MFIIRPTTNVIICSEPKFKRNYICMIECTNATVIQARDKVFLKHLI